MRLLVDTHLLVWASEGLERVPPMAFALMADEQNELHYSAASLWEVAIKFARGKADFQIDPHRLKAGLIANGYIELPITGEHAAATARLPPLHKDPFDRLLVAQATEAGLTLLTVDAQLAKYPGPIYLVR